MSTKAELIAENDQLREALKRIAVLGMNYGASKRSTLEHSLLEIEATARDALGQRHHLTALGYGPRAAALKKTR
jgi:DNA polymerase III sliding clamp (beta) subunit (PCNA family)